MSKLVHVYSLIDPFTNKPRYVGATTDLSNRLSAHLTPTSLKRNNAKNEWLRSLEEQDVKPIVKVLAVCKKENADKIEKKYITMYKKLGYPITNFQRGGKAGSKGMKMVYNNGVDLGEHARKRVYIVKAGKKRRKYFDSLYEVTKYLKANYKVVSRHLSKRRPKSVKGYFIYYDKDTRGEVTYKRNYLFYV